MNPLTTNPARAEVVRKFNAAFPRFAMNLNCDRHSLAIMKKFAGERGRGDIAGEIEAVLAEQNLAVK